MSGRKPRGLRPEEVELWKKVKGSTVPLRQSNLLVLKNAVENREPEEQPAAIQQFEIGQKSSFRTASNHLAPNLSTQLTRAPIQMDHKKFGQMTRGKLSPTSRIDLHGMTVAQAHPALVTFVMNAYAAQDRLVLVITGKGKYKPDHGPIPVRVGVLKQQVPHWLQSAPLRSVVMQVTEAHIKHGGAGAYYVYLRRNR